MHRVVLMFFFCYCLDAGTEAQCRGSEVKCRAINACIPRQFVCDLIRDCPGGEDEQNCPFQDSGCGSTVFQYGTSGSFTSVRYPQSFNGKVFCKWRIQVPDGQTVTLQFDNILNSWSPRTGGCLSDWLAVYQDGPSLKLIGSYYGKTAPPYLRIDSNKVVVHFDTDRQMAGCGYKVTWWAMDPPPPPTTLPTVRPRDLQCAEVVQVRGQRGSIDSPYLTDVNRGSSGINCRWQIQVDPGFFVHLSFPHFYLGQSCQNAVLNIYDGPNSNGRQLLSACGVDHPPNNVTSTSNYLFMSMNINDTIRYNKWFTADYSQTLTSRSLSGCDGVAREVTSESGWISSPNFDGRTQYRRNLDCQWDFMAGDNMYFEFSFTFFEVEMSTSCRHDYLRISEDNFEDNPSTAKELKRLCGYDLPFDVIPSSSKVTLTFHTDGFVQYGGFNMTYVMKRNPDNCVANLLRCDAGMCAQSAVCDGRNDCRDGSDEFICPYTPSCGSTPIRPRLTTPRIVGGNVALKGSWPWAVSVLDPSGEHACGGTLIDLQWVLTAAHCFISVDSRTYAGYSVVAGRFQLGVQDREEQHQSFHKVFVPANFNKNTFEDDIALIRLSSPFRRTNHVRPVCLPNGPVATGRYGWIVGWGETNNASCCQGRLKQAAVPVIAPSICRQEDYYGNRLLDHMMCAGYSYGGTDSCHGDSGGPFVVRRGASGPWEIQGVTSSGSACAVPKKPGIYTKVWDYMTWIQRTIATNN